MNLLRYRGEKLPFVQDELPFYTVKWQMRDLNELCAFLSFPTLDGTVRYLCPKECSREISVVSFDFFSSTKSQIKSHIFTVISESNE